MKKLIVSSQAESTQDPPACKEGETGRSGPYGLDGRQGDSATSPAVGAETKVKRDNTASDPSSPTQSSSKGGKGTKHKTSDSSEKPKPPRKPVLDRSSIPLGAAEQKRAAPGQGRYPRIT